MPNIQIRGSQIKTAAVEASNINLSGSFDFRAATGLQFLTKPEADKTTFPATTQFVHTIVSGSIVDGVQGGDGIAVNTGTSPDTISVDLATNGGLEISSAKLAVALDGSTLSLGAGGLSVGSAISNANIASDAAIAKSKLAALDITNSDINNSAAIAISKLAQSTISGKSLGTNLSDLTDGNGIADFSYNGGSGGVVAIDLDGSTLSVGASGLKIADDGVTSTQIADDAVGSAQIADSAVDNARIANGAVSIAKLAFQARQDVFTANGSTAAFALANQVAPEFENFVLVFVNGLLQSKVASSPSGQSEYTVSTAGSTTSVTFGANLTNGDAVEIRSLA